MTGPALGQLLALVSAICFAASSVLIARTTITRGDRGVAFSVLVTMVFSAALWLALEGPDLGPLAGEGAAVAVGWFAFAGLCAIVFGRSLLYRSIRSLGVTRATATKRLNPFFSVLLAALILAEPISGVAAVGMVVIAAAFALLVRASLRDPRPRPDGAEPVGLDYAWGVGSAFAYAASYVARKFGLAEMPAPALGTLIGALAGMAIFVVAAAFNANRRADLTGMFRNLDRWLIGAAVLVSLGQIAMFSALLHEDISVIVMIGSLEVFIAAFLSVAVFRSEARPDAATLAGAALAALGVVLVAAG